MSDRPGICGGCGDMDYPHAFIWCRDYKPKQQAVSTQIQTIQLKDCGEQAFEKPVHNPEDIIEIARLREAIESAMKELDRLRRQHAKPDQPETDTFTSIMLVANDK